MLSRFLSISLLAVSSSVFGVSCNRSAAGEQQPAVSCELPPEIPNPLGQWDRLLAGSPNLPLPVSRALLDGSQEEASALNPCVALRENRVSTVSMVDHYGQALDFYREALRLLDACEAEECGDRAQVRRRVNEKISLLTTSLESLSDMNRRYLPVTPH